jgi:glyoxylase-like metal-dependent hydrolase (beta-lactamase superfamily II)
LAYNQMSHISEDPSSRPSTSAAHTSPAPSPSDESINRFTRNVVPGVHRLQHAYVNCYLLEDESGLTLVDTAFPATWPLLQRAQAALGRSASDIKAIVLTHAHFDHLGMALRAQQEWGVPIYAHAAEYYIAEHPYRYEHERSRLLYPVRNPAAIPVLTRMAAAGALQVRGITDLQEIQPGATLDVPGQPRVIFSPGHTHGHCALFLPDADALITGDALVTLDPYTRAVGPQIVSGAATANSTEALHSLTALAETDASVLLPGHGQPWRAGVHEAVAQARAAGRS